MITVNNWGDLISLTAELGTLKTQVRYGLFQKASLGSLTPPLQSLVIFHNNPCCHSSSGPLRGGGERPIFFFSFFRGSVDIPVNKARATTTASLFCAFAPPTPPATERMIYSPRRVSKAPDFVLRAFLPFQILD